MIMNEKNTLGRRIAQARKSGLNRLTQAQVAKELGVTPQAVSGWERDEALPELDKIGRLATLLGTDITWLLRGLGEKVPRHYLDEISRDSRTSNRPDQKVSFFGDRDFPIYASTEGGSGALIIHSDVMEYARRPAILDGIPEAYGILVVGDSMVPSYRPGDVALIHPRKPPQRDTDVVLYKADPRTGDVESMIKRLIGFNDRTWKLEQYAPPKSFSEARSEWPICHYVIGRYNSRN